LLLLSQAQIARHRHAQQGGHRSADDHHLQGERQAKA
jgi:hypothetical protein